MAERLFFTGSTNIIRDPRPSGLDLRVYACVSLHDGMSLLKKSGRGCYATFATLTAEIGCDAANLSRSLKRLVGWGYLTEERQGDRRRKAYRVIFDTEEGWRFRQQSTGELVGNDHSGNGGNLSQTEQHYSSLKGLYPSEEEKLNSPEGARFARSSPGKIKFNDNGGAQLAAFERVFRSAPETIADAQIIERCEWLFGIVDKLDPDDPNYQRAQRLYFDVDIYLWERGLRPDEEAA